MNESWDEYSDEDWDENCVFCQIFENEEYDHLDFEFGVMSFIPLDPVVPGHRLFAPVGHVVDAVEDYGSTADAFGAAAKYIQDTNLESFNLITNAGEPATQSVFHLHVHLIPREPGDGLKLPWTEESS